MSTNATDSAHGKTSEKQRKMVPLRYVLTPIAIIFAAIILLMIFGAMAPKPAKKPIEIKAPLVQVQTVEKSTIAFSVSSQGTVVPRTETQLISEVSGNVVSVSEKFEVGGFFRKGEQLMQIDDITYKVALLRAEAALESAKAELEREIAQAKQAKDEWLLTGKPLADAPSLALRKPQMKIAKASVKSAEASLKEAKVKLARTKIVAPYDAMLKAKQADIGQYVVTGGAVATTFAVDYAEVRLPVKQRDIRFLNLPKVTQTKRAQGQVTGSNIDLYMDTDGKKMHWAAKLARYEGVVDSASRVHYVVARINDPYNINAQTNKEEVRIGTFVNAKVSGKEIDGLYAIPRPAIHGANSIYLIDSDNKLHIESVDVLRADSEFIYTRDNIEQGLRLVTTNLTTPVEGMSLRVAGEESEMASSSDKAEETETKDSGDA